MTLAGVIPRVGSKYFTISIHADTYPAIPYQLGQLSRCIRALETDTRRGEGANCALARVQQTCVVFGKECVISESEGGSVALFDGCGNRLSYVRQLMDAACGRLIHDIVF